MTKGFASSYRLVLVATTVVATGQHFIADIAAGIAVVLPAWIIARRITHAGRPRTIRPADA